MRKAFTLLEVVVAVMILSIVATALLQLYAGNTRYFGRMQSSGATGLDATLLLGNAPEGSASVRVDRLIAPFATDETLRRASAQRTIAVRHRLVRQIRPGSHGSASWVPAVEIDECVVGPEEARVRVYRLRTP